MNLLNEVASVFLWLIVGFWFLHILNNKGTDYIKSFFSDSTSSIISGSGYQSTGPLDATKQEQAVYGPYAQTPNFPTLRPGKPT